MFLVYLSNHTNHTTTAERRAEKQWQCRGALFYFFVFLLTAGVGHQQPPHRNRQVNLMIRICFFFSFLSCISHIIPFTPQQQSAEPRNSASAEALFFFFVFVFLLAATAGRRQPPHWGRQVNLTMSESYKLKTPRLIVGGGLS